MSASDSRKSNRLPRWDRVLPVEILVENRYYGFIRGYVMKLDGMKALIDYDCTSTPPEWIHLERIYSHRHISGNPKVYESDDEKYSYNEYDYNPYKNIYSDDDDEVNYQGLQILYRRSPKKPAAWWLVKSAKHHYSINGWMAIKLPCPGYEDRRIIIDRGSCDDKYGVYNSDNVDRTRMPVSLKKREIKLPEDSIVNHASFAKFWQLKTGTKITEICTTSDANGKIVTVLHLVSNDISHNISDSEKLTKLLAITAEEIQEETYKKEKESLLSEKRDSFGKQKDSVNTSLFDGLPAEMIATIIKYLDVVDRLRLKRVSRRWNAIITSRYVLEKCLIFGHCNGRRELDQFFYRILGKCLADKPSSLIICCQVEYSSNLPKERDGSSSDVCRVGDGFNHWIKECAREAYGYNEYVETAKGIVLFPWLETLLLNGMSMIPKNLVFSSLRRLQMENVILYNTPDAACDYPHLDLRCTIIRVKNVDIVLQNTSLTKEILWNAVQKGCLPLTQRQLDDLADLFPLTEKFMKLTRFSNFKWLPEMVSKEIETLLQVCKASSAPTYRRHIEILSPITQQTLRNLRSIMWGEYRQYRLREHQPHTPNYFFETVCSESDTGLNTDWIPQLLDRNTV